MMRISTAVVLLYTAGALTGCKPHEFHPPSEEKRIAQADSLYSPALFDSIGWPSDSVKLLAGNAVWAEKCDKCHGPLGEGGTDYAAQRQLNVPSLVRPDWPLEGQRDSVRHRIFVGHTAGMPTWGVAGISPRQVDAVTAYVLQQLRPEALTRAAPKTKTK